MTLVNFCMVYQGFSSLLGIYNIMASPLQHIARMWQSCIMLAWPMLPIKVCWYAQDNAGITIGNAQIKEERLGCNKQGWEKIRTA